MKHSRAPSYIILPAILFLLFTFGALAQPPIGSKNFGTIYRPFDWYQIDADSGRFTVYFSHPIENVAHQTLREMQLLEEEYTKIFITTVPIRLPKDSSGHVKKDSAGHVMRDTIAWHPKSLSVILYPNMQDFGQQKIIPFFLPPGVLGFTEFLDERVAIPYGGNDHEFRSTVAHELGHAWQQNFVKAQAENADLEDHVKNASPRIPLWFSEGFAEWVTYDVYLAQAGERDNLRIRQAAMVSLMLSAYGDVPTLEDLAEFGDFRVYALGFDFLHFMTGRYDWTVWQSLLTKLAYNEKFEEAWQHTFREPLATSETKWHTSLEARYYFTLYSPEPPDLSKRYLSDSLYPGIGKIRSMGGMGFDPATGDCIYYEESSKRGIRVVVQNLRSGERHAVTRQFDDQSLFFRPGNTPAISGDRIGLVISKAEQDHIRTYRLKKRIRQRGLGIGVFDSGRVVGQRSCLCGQRFVAVCRNGYAGAYGDLSAFPKQS